MKRLLIAFCSGLVLVLGGVGCSRTVEDVAKWTAAGNLDKLEKALADPKVEVRQAAAEALGDLKAEGSVDVLASCLNDGEMEVKIAAVEALIAIGSSNTVTPLTASLKLEDADIRIRAARSLGTLKAVGAIPTLIDTLDDPVPEVQVAACEALGRMPGSRGAEPLVERLQRGSSPDLLRIACVQGLARAGGSVAMEALVGVLDDRNEQLRDEAIAALLRIGNDAVPAMIGGLRNEKAAIREASIRLLRGLGAIPAKGSDFVWYQLARVSLDDNAALRDEVVALLADQGQDAVAVLMDGAGHRVPAMRECAALALERMGESVLDSLVVQVRTAAGADARRWFEARDEWAGAPSTMLDLWGAVSALNPDFSLPAPTVLQSPADAAIERAAVPMLIQFLAEPELRKQASVKLEAAGACADLPLIAALASTNTAVSEAAAEIMKEKRDARAFQPLLDALRKRLDAGEMLSKSSLYSALLAMDSPDAEEVVRKIRPNTERAIQFVSRQYPSAKFFGASCFDPYTSNTDPVEFHVAYILEEKSGTLEVVFKQDDNGNWYPSPALPHRLPLP